MCTPAWTSRVPATYLTHRPPAQCHAVRPAAKPRGLYWDHLDPAKISAIPALKSHLARPDETTRPRDASTQSGCQFASHGASPCAFLLRLVTPHPLFTLADAAPQPDFFGGGSSAAGGAHTAVPRSSDQPSGRPGRVQVDRIGTEPMTSQQREQAAAALAALITAWQRDLAPNA